MNEEECPHGADASTCPPCRKAEGKSNAVLDEDKDPRGDKNEPWLAAYDGWCAGCKDKIERYQDMIVRLGHNYYHEECA